MEIALLTAGSHGDVAPFVALARGLLAAGHSVRLAAPSENEGLVVGAGIEFASLEVDFRALADSEAVKGATNGSPRAMLRAYRESQDSMRTLIWAAGQAAEDADAIVFHPKAFVGGHIAEARGIPVWLWSAAPVLVPTAEFAVPVSSRLQLGPLNRLSYKASLGNTMPYRSMINEWRAETLGLPPMGRLADPFSAAGQALPVLYSFSEAVVPRPADWPDSVHVTGYWFPDADPGDGLDAELDAFLDAGEPPVYVGFGSLAGKDPGATTRLVLEAIRAAGVRAVLATGWGGLAADEVPASVHLVEGAPHDLLFPRCAAVVHHGGSGTTAAGLRAGVPSVICPFFGDQPFWGAQVSRIGAGPEPIAQRRLTSERLATALDLAVADPGMRARAQAIGRTLRAEDGVAVAVGLIEAAAESAGR